MNERYSHLYNATPYVPPSAIRQMEKVKGSIGDTYGDVRVNQSSIEAITGQAGMMDLINRKLKNRDIYSAMKNKINYSTSAEIINHMKLNNL